ncbi:transposase [Solibacillus sp. FSL W7-1324]|uniref:transposase n=1 Tax=Solibacillus sp. FSL W7-1324 TaxID=2921701 RepID=UPI0030F9A4BB
MSQTFTLQIKLMPSKEQALILKAMSENYIQTINNLVDEMVNVKQTTKKTSKDVQVDLPSAVKNQAIKDAKSIFSKVRMKKFSIVPLLKKLVCVWNNQNYSFDSTSISMPLYIDGKVKKVPIRALMKDENNRIQKALTENKLGTLRITQKKKKWIAQIALTSEPVFKNGTKIMGVDLGIKVPAVAVTSDDKISFFGNGRMNKFKKRKFRSTRKNLGKRKKIAAIKSLNDKEQRYMKDQDHKISRSIVNFAIEHKISVIRLEQLANIRQTARTSRKNEKNLHIWSFYRLAQYIEYKANLSGIQVEFVNPFYTSQTCPSCSERNKAKDRTYKCNCGFKKHRDIVGAMNIRYAPVVDGNSQSA